nr:YitT family protein [uncultured Oscillibacter sp.]
MTAAVRQHLKSYALITLGSVIYALSFDWFVAPNHFAMGGVTGLAQILHHLFPALTVGAASALMNVPLFLIGWKKIGGHLLVSSLYAMVVSNAAIDGLNLLFDFQPMDPILAALFGGGVMGFGLGLVFAQGATTGGTDIVAKLLKLKWPWLPIGKLVALPDTAVMLLVALTFGQLSAMLYGFIKLYTCSRAMDAVLYGVVDSRVAYIISDRWKELSGTLLRDQRRGVTLLQGQGAYTGAEKRVLMIAFKQKEIVDLKRRVYELDPEAFLIVCDARDVLGNGFSAYRREEI